MRRIKKIDSYVGAGDDGVSARDEFVFLALGGFHVLFKRGPSSPSVTFLRR